MRKIISILLVILLTVSVPMLVAAEEGNRCTITVESVAGSPGGTVTVAVSIAEHPGFTNLAIALEYDKEKLTLQSIQPHPDEQSCLKGAQISTNLNWQDETGNSAAFLVSASDVPVRDDGVLFTATFETSSEFLGETVVTPRVLYVRNNEAVFSVFEELHSATVSGTVYSVPYGDINGDGIVEYNDVMLAYKAFLGQIELPLMQMGAADRDGNGTVDEWEYRLIYEIYLGG